MELLRFVFRNGEILWDEKHKLPGRGAYVHRKVSCWAKMNETARWTRCLRLDAKEVGRESLANLMELVRPKVEGFLPSEVSKSNVHGKKLRI